MAKLHKFKLPLALVQLEKSDYLQKKWGLGIIDPKVHAQAMCAKFLVTLTTSHQSWAKMANECLNLAKLRSQVGPWKGVGPFDKLLAPRWSTLSF